MRSHGTTFATAIAPLGRRNGLDLWVRPHMMYLVAIGVGLTEFLLHAQIFSSRCIQSAPRPPPQHVPAVTHTTPHPFTMHDRDDAILLVDAHNPRLHERPSVAASIQGAPAQPFVSVATRSAAFQFGDLSSSSAVCDEQNVRQDVQHAAVHDGTPSGARKSNSACGRPGSRSQNDRPPRSRAAPDGSSASST